MGDIICLDKAREDRPYKDPVMTRAMGLKGDYVRDKKESFYATILRVGDESVYTPDRFLMNRLDLLKAEKRPLSIIGAEYREQPFTLWDYVGKCDQDRIARGDQGLLITLGSNDIESRPEVIVSEGACYSFFTNCPEMVVSGDMHYPFFEELKSECSRSEKLIGKRVTAYMKGTSLIGIGLKRRAL